MVAGKTGVFDDSIMIDSDEWIHPFLAVLVQGRRPEQALWKSDGNRSVTLFMNACQHLGLMGLSPCRYALRHGGPATTWRVIGETSPASRSGEAGERRPAVATMRRRRDCRRR